MEVPKKLLEKWNALYSTGDAQKLADVSGYSDETYKRALRTGKCNDDVFEALAKFYKEKAELIKQFL